MDRVYNDGVGSAATIIYRGIELFGSYKEVSWMEMTPCVFLAGLGLGKRYRDAAIQV